MFSLDYVRFPTGRVVHLVLTVDPELVDALRHPRRSTLFSRHGDHVRTAPEVLCSKMWRGRQACYVPCSSGDGRLCMDCEFLLQEFEIFLSDVEWGRYPCDCMGMCPCHTDIAARRAREGRT